MQAHCQDFINDELCNILHELSQCPSALSSLDLRIDASFRLAWIIHGSSVTILVNS